MPWVAVGSGLTVPIVYKGRESGVWWVDWSMDEDHAGFDTWREAYDFAVKSIHKVTD